MDPSSTVYSRRRSTAGVPSARGIGARDSAYTHAHGSRGPPEQRLAVPQRTDGRLLVRHRFPSPQAHDQDLDCTEGAACLERIRAVASSGSMARASGLAPAASFISLKTHLVSTTSSRHRRRQLSVAARSSARVHPGWRPPQTAGFPSSRHAHTRARAHTHTHTVRVDQERSCQPCLCTALHA